MDYVKCKLALGVFSCIVKDLGMSLTQTSEGAEIPKPNQLLTCNHHVYGDPAQRDPREQDRSWAPKETPPESNDMKVCLIPGQRGSRFSPEALHRCGKGPGSNEGNDAQERHCHRRRID
jgi:hypothetical protein